MIVMSCRSSHDTIERHPMEAWLLTFHRWVALALLRRQLRRRARRIQQVVPA
jgi:hypothetical protein